PVAMGPALWRRGGGWRFAACGAVTIAVLYACYAGAGWGVSGFLRGYQAEEGLDNGSGVWLLAGLGLLHALPYWAVTVYGAVAALAFGLYSLWIMIPARRDPDVVTVCGHAAILIACVTLAISPHYPWYFAWLALPAIVKPNRAVVWLSAVPVVLW